MDAGGCRGVGRNSVMDVLRYCWDDTDTSSFDSILPSISYKHKQIQNIISYN